MQRGLQPSRRRKKPEKRVTVKDIILELLRAGIIASEDLGCPEGDPACGGPDAPRHAALGCAAARLAGRFIWYYVLGKELEPTWDTVATSWLATGKMDLRIRWAAAAVAQNREKTARRPRA